MDPLTFVGVGLVVAVFWLLGREDAAVEEDTPAEPPLPTPKLIPADPGSSDAPEMPKLIPPPTPHLDDDDDVPATPSVEPSGLTDEEKARRTIQLRLDSLGYSTPTTGKRTPLYVSAVDAFQYDVLKGENYYAGGQAGSRPVELLQMYGRMQVDGWAGKQTSKWLHWAINNKTAFSEVTYAATGSYPGFD